MTWDATTSWNVCKTLKCRGPVEGDGGSVEFFDGSEAHCIECGRQYTVVVNDGDAWLVNVYEPRKRKAGKR